MKCADSKREAYRFNQPSIGATTKMQSLEEVKKTSSNSLHDFVGAPSNNQRFVA
jgi:hypothetical protein